MVEDNNMFDALLRTAKTESRPVEGGSNIKYDEGASEYIVKDILSFSKTFRTVTEEWLERIKTITQKDEEFTKTLKKTMAYYESEYDDPKKYDKLFDLGFVYPCLNRINSFLSKTGLSLINRTADIFKFSWTIIKSVAGFVGDTLKFLLGPAANFIKMVTLPIWNALKGILKIGLSVVSWVFRFGMKMVEYIWKGVKTIFKFGFYAISKVAGFLWRGTVGFLKWWFNGIFSAILSFNPLAILFYGGVFVAFLAGVSILLGVITPVIEVLFGTAAELTKMFSKWVEDSLSSIFDYARTVYYNTPWLSTFVNNTWNLLTGFFDDYFKEGSVLGNVVQWAREAYKWISNNVGYIIEAIETPIKEIKKYIGSPDNPSQTLLGVLLNFFKTAVIDYNVSSNYILHLPIRYIPGISLATKVIEDMFGYSVGVEGESTLIQTRIHQTENKIAEQLLEIQISSLEAKGFKGEELQTHLERFVIPELQSKYKLSGAEATTVTKQAKDNLRQIKIGLLKFTPNDYILEEKASLEKLRTMQNEIRNGIFDVTKEHTTMLYNLNIESLNLLSSEQERRKDVATKEMQEISNIMMNQQNEQQDYILAQTHYNLNFPNLITPESSHQDTANLVGEIGKFITPVEASKLWAPSTITEMKNRSSPPPKPSLFQSAMGKVSKMFVNTEKNEKLMSKLDLSFVSLFTEDPQNEGAIRTAIKDEINFVSNITSIEGFLKNNGITIDKVIENFSNALGKKYPNVNQYTITAIKNVLTQAYNLSTTLETSLAHGAILPNRTDIKNIIPLDSIGREYIREQVKSIKIDESKKIKNKEGKSHITIIEENSVYGESYELYTMSQISKGILGV